MNRYNNPKVIDHLASSYALGLLKGRTKKRFEILMERMPFLRTHVAINNERFSHFLELLPEQKPDKKVWNNISQAIKSETLDLKNSRITKDPWYSFLTHRFSYILSGVMVLVLTVSFIYPYLIQYQKSSQIYKAVLVSESDAVVTIIANKNEMVLEVDVAELIPVKEGETAILWCIDKDKNKPPINMGSINLQGLTKISLVSKWDGIMAASAFAISIEPSNTVLSKSTRRVIYRGSFNVSTKS